MAAAEISLQNILRALIAMAPYPPSPNKWDDIRQLRQSFIERIPASPAAERSEYSSRIAYQLLQISMSSHSTALIRICLEFWLSIGPVGWTLAVRYLQHKIIPMNILVELISGFPMPDRLLLLNQHFQTTRPTDQMFLKWAEETLFAAGGLEPEDALAFFERLGGEPLAIPLREALLKDRFSEWIGGVLEHPLSEDDVSKAARTICKLQEWRFESLVAEYLETDDASVLQNVLDCLRRIGTKGSPPYAQTLVKVLGHENPALRLMALDAMVELRVVNLDKIFPYLLRKHPETRHEVLRRVLRLDRQTLQRVLAGLPPQERQEAVQQIFLLIARTDQEFLRAFCARILQRAESSSSLSPEFVSQIKAFDAHLQGNPAERDGVFPLDETQPTDTGAHAGAAVSERSDAVKQLSADSDVLRSLAAGKDIKGGNLEGVGISDYGLRDRTMKWTSWKNSMFRGVSFENVTFIDADFSGCVFSDVIFHNCRFQNSRFGGAVFSNCLFQWVVLTNCNLDRAVLHKCRMTGLVAQGCSLVRLTGGVLDISLSLLRESGMWGASLSGCDLSSMRFDSVDVSGGQLRTVKLRGVEFLDCAFENSLWEGVQALNPTFSSCAFSGGCFNALTTDSPQLHEAQQQANLSRSADEKEAAKPVLDLLSSDQGRNLAVKIVDAWFRQQDFATRRHAFARERQRRTSLGLEKLGADKTELVVLLPYLLQSDLFEKRKQLMQKYPLFVIDGYFPDYRTWDLIQKHFDKFELEEPEAGSPRILAIYTMGSFGTLAQVLASNVDYWICLEADGKTKELLKEKLGLIRDWAYQEFGLDFRFQVFDQSEFRDARFGYREGESAGQAQALIRKEEFYRTALKLQGRDLLWWLTPPEATDEDYAAIAAELAQSPLGWSRSILDLGNVSDSSRADYIRALLWQIIKTFETPYVTIMLFARLQRFLIKGDGAQDKLCEHLKRNIFAGVRSLAKRDPFAVLFMEVRSFFTAIKDEQGSELINLAFILKSQCESEVSDLQTPLSIQRNRAVSDLFGSREAGVNDICRLTKSSFDNLSRIGALINAFIYKSFETVHGAYEKTMGAAPVQSPELTKLGRKIASAFSKRANKIDRIAFVNPMTGVFREVLFFAERTPGRPTLWGIKGQMAGGNAKREDMVEIKRDKSLPLLFSWLIANRFYHPKLVLDADHTTNPLSPRDIRELARTLHDFFPPEKTLDVDVDESLQKERVVRAFFILNLTVARDINRVFETSIVFATNWGEMFCMSMQVYDPTFKDNPMAFLKKKVPMECDPNAVLGYYMPSKSRCPKPNIAQITPAVSLEEENGAAGGNKTESNGQGGDTTP